MERRGAHDFAERMRQITGPVVLYGIAIGAY